jgi:hypothetical protein
MPYQAGLPAALRRFGLQVETVAGWETRGSSSLTPVGALSHWTAGPRGSTNRPSLNICINGRAGLPGPLANVYLDRKGIAVVLAAGVANHGGVGNWRGHSGNSKFFGTEAECGGDGDWSAAQRDAYPRVNAAYCWLGKFGPEMCAGHHEYATPAGRKIDIRDWPMSAMRAQVAALLATPTTAAAVSEEDDMPYTPDELKALIRDAINNDVKFKARNGETITLPQALERIEANSLAGLQHQQGYGKRIENTEARVIALEAAVLTLSENNELTADEIEDAVGKALRDNTVRVDIDVAGGDQP